MSLDAAATNTIGKQQETENLEIAAKKFVYLVNQKKKKEALNYLRGLREQEKEYVHRKYKLLVKEARTQF